MHDGLLNAVLQQFLADTLRAAIEEDLVPRATQWQDHVSGKDLVPRATQWQDHVSGKKHKHKLLIAPRSTSQVSAQESAAPGKEIHDITCFPLETATSSNEKEKSIGKTTPVVWATTSRNCYPTDPAYLSPVQCGEPLRVGKCTEHQECQEYFAYPTCTACIDQFWFPQPWPTTPRTIIRILPACGSHNASHIPAYGTCHMNLYTLSSERSHPHSQ